MSDVHMESASAQLLSHLVELRARLIKSVLAFAVAFALCFTFADHIFNILIYPFEMAAGSSVVKFIYTAPQEYFLTQMKLAMFGAVFIAFPLIATQLYMFVAPGLYQNERKAFLPFLVATPILFLLGSALVYFMVLPLALHFFMGMQQSGADGEAAIELLPRVSEYLGLMMSLIIAFGFCFQLPILLTLLARIGLIGSAQLRKGRRYAIVAAFAAAAILTPPDLISQFSLGIPIVLLYEISIWAVVLIERKA